MVGLAQLVSASGCGPEGRGFESHISPHEKTHLLSQMCFFQLYSPVASYIHKCVICPSRVGSYKANTISLLRSKNITLSESEAYH